MILAWTFGSILENGFEWACANPWLAALIIAACVVGAVAFAGLAGALSAGSLLATASYATIGATLGSSKAFADALGTFRSHVAGPGIPRGARTAFVDGFIAIIVDVVAKLRSTRKYCVVIVVAIFVGRSARIISGRSEPVFVLVIANRRFLDRHRTAVGTESP